MIGGVQTMPNFSQNTAQVKRSTPNPPPHTSVCVICGKPFSKMVFYTGAWRLHNTKTTCSVECSRENDRQRKRRQTKAAKALRPKRGQVLCKCPMCQRQHLMRGPTDTHRYCRDCAIAVSYRYGENVWRGQK